MTSAPSLPGLRVAISISTFPGDDLPARGLSDQHVDHAFFELVRHLLAAGACIAYGGDLRKYGYTIKLIGLLNRYPDATRPRRDRVIQYLAWPRYHHDDEDRAKLVDVATLIRVPAPVDDPPDPVTFDPTASPETRVLNAQALIAMRERMTAESDARVILGGSTTGHTSRFPGVAEEAYLAARAGRPLYVLGGFGGCAGCVADAIRGQRPEELTSEYQRAHTEAYDDLAGLRQDVDEDALLDVLHRNAPGQVPNGLDQAENERLLEVVDLDEVVALVVRGLRNLPPAG